MPRTEQSDLPSHASAQDITRHLYATQFLPGAAVVITANPPLFFTLVRQEWEERLGWLERHHADAGVIARMATMHFSRHPEDEHKTGVFFITPAQLDKKLPVCHTAYVAFRLTAEQLAKVEKCMTDDGLIVHYAQ